MPTGTVSAPSSIELNQQEIFDDWARKVHQRNLGVSGGIFAIENVHARSGRYGWCGAAVLLLFNLLATAAPSFLATADLVVLRLARLHVSVVGLTVLVQGGPFDGTLQGDPK